MGKTSKSWVVPTRSMADKVGETSKGSKGACPLRDNKGVRHDSGGRGGGGGVLFRGVDFNGIPSLWTEDQLKQVGFWDVKPD